MRKQAQSDNRVVTGWLLLALLAGTSWSPNLRAAPGDASNNDARLNETLSAERGRLVKLFDFNEEPLGNYDSQPMHWQRHRAVGFPHYLSAGFDRNIGDPAAPCFRLDLNGGSIAYHYRTRSIEVAKNSDYVIFCTIRTEKLRRARAYVSAAMMNRVGEIIPDTEVFSRTVGDEAEQGRWQRIQLQLLGARDARFITLSLWLTQPGITAGYRPANEPRNQIDDIHGSAWFDDLRVYRLPRVRLETGIPGNVFDDPTPVKLRVLVCDTDGTGLSATLTVTDAADVVRLNSALPIRPIEQVEPDPVLLADVEPGVYRAELTVQTPSGVLGSRVLPFARLAPRLHDRRNMKQSGRGFGVNLSDAEEPLGDGRLRLIDELGMEWVKVPIWSLRAATTSAPAAPMPAIGANLTQLAQHNRKLVGWLAPESVAKSRYSEQPSLLAVLSADSINWRPSLAYSWSLYSGLVQWWQIGSERNTDLVWDDRWPAALKNVHDQMKQLMEQPRLVMPSTVLRAIDAPPSPPGVVSAIASCVPASLPVAAFVGQWKAGPSADMPLWLTVEAASDAYPRPARLAELAKRLILARASDAALVFVPHAWQSASTGEVSPTEDFIIYRTIAEMLGDVTSAGSIVLDGRAECRVFDRGGIAVMAIWDDYAPPEGRDHWLPLDAGARQVNLWGAAESLPESGGECRVRIGRMPTFVESTPTWLARLRQSLVLSPTCVEANRQGQEIIARFTNPREEAISGRLRVIAPAGWSVVTPRQTFVLAPGQAHEVKLSLNCPITETAGLKVLVAEFEIDAERRYRVRVPGWFELGLNGIDVEAFVQRSGTDAVVRQTITNHTDRTVSFYGSLFSSQGEEVQRLVPNLRPGQTVTREYEIPNAGELTGRRIRLALREVNGGRIWNRLMDIP